MGERQRTWADELHAQIERLKAERDAAWNEAIEAAAELCDRLSGASWIASAAECRDAIRNLKRGAAAQQKGGTDGE